MMIDFRRWTSSATSVTRLGGLLEFGQLFKAFGNNKFAQFSHILRLFLATPASFSFIFDLFQTNINTILQQINVKNVPPVYCAGIHTHDIYNMSLLA